jgi:hypothetical protein
VPFVVTRVTSSCLGRLSKDGVLPVPFETGKDGADDSVCDLRDAEDGCRPSPVSHSEVPGKNVCRIITLSSRRRLSCARILGQWRVVRPPQPRWAKPDPLQLRGEAALVVPVPVVNRDWVCSRSLMPLHGALLGRQRWPESLCLRNMVDCGKGKEERLVVRHGCDDGSGGGADGEPFCGSLYAQPE